MLQLTGLELRRGSKLLIEAADLRVYPRHKVGLVGANGCGKSSLFALLRGELTPDGGTVSIPAGWQISHVAQQTPGGERPAIEFVIDGDKELREAQSALQQAEHDDDGLRQAELHDRLESIGGYEA